jgi:hypothetical protein
VTNLYDKDDKIIKTLTMKQYFGEHMNLVNKGHYPYEWMDDIS